ncbi:hypothetical protein P1X14_03165 [Sphingomonas sp. AOB5]|uniref:hypothetical protein n=1 Tax=Sphingomonas sp. AOB5 TaxID=3034017 RepID=UPI0023FA220D|nr:hypothetical protein [Sphingomonas sp. AOB5]MDF7774238.1 hypothetical protein [Sphingomonas sp. AOB5]
MDMPPTRYRVVEQGRRLVVIDNWTGQPVQYSAGTPQPPRNDLGAAPRSTIEQASATLRAHATTHKPQRTTNAGLGGADWIITTQSWFDDEGPRRLRISPGGQGGLTMTIGILAALAIAAIFFLGWLLIPATLFVLLQSGPRKMIRAAITGWLTGLGEEV